MVKEHDDSRMSRRMEEATRRIKDKNVLDNFWNRQNLNQKLTAPTEKELKEFAKDKGIHPDTVEEFLVGEDV